MNHVINSNFNKYTMPQNMSPMSDKERLFCGMSAKDKDFLKKCFKQGFKTIPNLTRNIYFDAVKYALSGFDSSVLSGTNVDAYNKYTQYWVGNADDNFGAIKNPDCPSDFKNWYDKYAYDGGHPFEIYPYCCLYVKNNNKNEFYLSLDSMHAAINPEKLNILLRMYMEIYKNGFSCDFSTTYKNYVLDILNKRLK